MTMSREIRLGHAPEGAVRAEDFELVGVALPPVGPDHVLVRNLAMSIDPYMRLMLSSQAGYLAATQPGAVMNGAAVGVVEESRAADLPVGGLVVSQMGWRSHFVAPWSALTPVGRDVPADWHLGVLGLTGMTAYIAIERVLRPRAGETVFVSGAAGAVGSIACQLAKLRGARVLGSASSADKTKWLIDHLGLDAAFDRRDTPAQDFLAREAPDGIDCYLDNVGGAMLETLIDSMKAYGKVALCGAMSRYEGEDYRGGPANFFALVEKSLSVTGFNAFLLAPDDKAAIVAWLRERALDGRIKPAAAIVQGLEAAPAAFAALFGKGFLGKVVVEL